MTEIERLLDLAEVVGGAGWEYMVAGVYARAVVHTCIAALASLIAIGGLGVAFRSEIPDRQSAGLMAGVIFGVTGLMIVGTTLHCLLTPEYCAIMEVLP